MEAIKKFLEERPLYSKFTGNLPKHNYQLYPGIIMLDCSICKGVRPFHKPGYGRGIPWITQGDGPPPGTPENLKTSIVGDPVRPALRAGVYSLEYECTGCLEERFWCWIEVNTEQQWIRKIGQVPPWSKRLDKNLAKLITSHQDYYKKGLACESHSYGIGAYAYYRRIVEEIIDELLSLISELIEPSEKEKYSKAIEETKKTIVAQDKIALVKDLLPPVLRPEGMNPLSVLHRSLSEGIHDRTDDECLELAQYIRESLVFLSDQLAIHRESSKRFTESMRKLLDRKSGKEGEA